jgi:hypothetical protein
MADRIEGVVITFANITEAKTLEVKLCGQHVSLGQDVTDQSAKRATVGKDAPSEATARKRTKDNGKARRSREP